MSTLAIYGGRPVRERMLPYGHQHVDEEDIAAVASALRGEWITQGPLVEAFERAVAERCGSRYGVAMSSGTAALHAACAAAGLGPGDEAITSPITFAATANAVVYCGARPVFADIRPDTLTIDPVEVERHMSPRVKAILPVDFAGLPAILPLFHSRANTRRPFIIRDAAHSLGASYRGLRIGQMADMTVLSFHPVKHITTGEGGMVLTDDPDLYERLRRFRHHGIVRGGSVGDMGGGAWYYEIPTLGCNYRLTDFQSALGLSQLRKLEWFVARRRAIAARYNEALRDLPSVILPVEPEGYMSAYHIYVLQLVPEYLTADRRTIFDALRAEGIGVNVHYIPVHLQPFYRKHFGYRPGDYPVAERYYERALTLPIFPAMSEGDVEDVIVAVRKVLTYFAR